MVALPNELFMFSDKYRDWEPTQEERYEFWDGELVPMSDGTRDHNRISENWFKLLNNALLNRAFNVYSTYVKVQLESGLKYFYPDVMVTCCKDDRDVDIVKFPCLIAEVLSPSTEAIDRGAKFEAYRQVKSLQEYILVQVDRPKVEVFQRKDINQWVLSEYDLDDRLLLESIGVEIAISDLYRYVQWDPNEWRLIV
jgi:Uma2 family endonuclease